MYISTFAEKENNTIKLGITSFYSKRKDNKYNVIEKID
mgnify:CR=1 FL=1